MLAQIKTTPLTPIHQKLGAKMTEFAGFTMPLYYKGIMEEHRAVRQGAGLFDISHMGKVSVAGPGAFAFLQKILTNDLSQCAPSQTLYSVMCREDGGVIDDVIVSCLSETQFFVIVNCSRKERDLAWFRENQEGEVEIHDLSTDFCGLALQGPKSGAVLQKVLNLGVEEVARHGVVWARAYDHGGVLSRTGYTGEDGFELFFPAEIAAHLWENFFEAGEEEGLAPCGLGARDTLRLEMGYSLYGSELSEETTPFEANLAWTVKLDKGPFIGREALARQKSQGISRKLVGLKILAKGPIPRHGCPVTSRGESVGEVTSGSFAPSLGEPVALAYVKKGSEAVGTDVEILVHDRRVPAVVRKLPFYGTGYVGTGFTKPVPT